MKKQKASMASLSSDALIGLASLYIFMLALLGVIFRVFDIAWIYFNPPLKWHIGLHLMDRMM